MCLVFLFKLVFVCHGLQYIKYLHFLGINLIQIPASSFLKNDVGDCFGFSVILSDNSTLYFERMVTIAAFT